MGVTTSRSFSKGLVIWKTDILARGHDLIIKGVHPIRKVNKHAPRRTLLATSAARNGRMHRCEGHKASETPQGMATVDDKY